MTRVAEVLATGGDYFEGARWHDGRWYVSDIYSQTVCAYDPVSGERTNLMHVEGNPSGLGWLPDGSLLVVSMHDRRLLRQMPDGEVRVHSDLSRLCPYDINDMVVDGRGRAWVGTIGFGITEGEAPRPGVLVRVDPDGGAFAVADELWCPNGIVMTADERTLIVAESFAGRLTAFTIDADGSLGDRRVYAQVGEPPAPDSTEAMMGALAIVPDGCAIDAADHVWAADAVGNRCVRLAPGGEVVDEVVDPEGRGIYACALGGPDGHTLLVCSVAGFFEAAQGLKGTANLLTTRVDVAHGGRP